MCGIHISTQPSNLVTSKARERMRRRGPDLQSFVKHEGLFFWHSLLSMDGSLTSQPYIKDHVCAVFNGEIYNHNKFSILPSEIEAIVDSYINHGESVFQVLDGEFAICLLDFKKNILYLTSDIFGSKPLFYASSDDEGWGIGTFPSSVSQFGTPIRVPANSVLSFDIKSLAPKGCRQLFEFSLEQIDKSYDGFFEALESSVIKRVIRNPAPFVPLSGGLDSGTIAAILEKFGIPFISGTIIGAEDPVTVSERILRRTGPAYVHSFLSSSDLAESLKCLQEDIEDFYYGPTASEPTHIGKDDPGALGLYFLLDDATKKHPVQTILSGQGGDEIMGTSQSYGFRLVNPPIFPDNLKEIYPWNNFYHGANQSYLIRDEFVGSNFGLETRYPLLDKAVVQKFLNLAPHLKNGVNKQPLVEYLKRLDYPYNGVKTGFNLHR
jgi:asparagine synthetase B (glutamine-hydrolysing)